MITSLINQLLFVSLSAQTADSGASSRSNPAAVRSRWTFPWLELGWRGYNFGYICQIRGVFGRQEPLQVVEKTGTPGRIRTCDLRIRSPLLYPG